jgi:hypothetical protein
VGYGPFVNVDERRTALWRVRNGKIRFMEFFVKPEQAWAEAGVERP